MASRPEPAVYETLGVAPGSSDLDAIRSSFRKRAKDLHPDVNSAPDAAEEFRRLVSAFETLISYLASPGASADDAWGAGASGAADAWGEGATTLEWTVPSPPDFHSYDELPEIKDEGAH